MRPRTATCECCRYFEAVDAVSGDGHCRRHAPMPVEIKSKTPDLYPTFGFIPVWPAVARSDWCGEHER